MRVAAGKQQLSSNCGFLNLRIFRMLGHQVLFWRVDGNYEAYLTPISVSLRMQQLQFISDCTYTTYTVCPKSHATQSLKINILLVW
jgi:hypothetical protein